MTSFSDLTISAVSLTEIGYIENRRNFDYQHFPANSFSLYYIERGDLFISKRKHCIHLMDGDYCLLSSEEPYQLKSNSLDIANFFFVTFLYFTPFSTELIKVIDQPTKITDEQQALLKKMYIDAQKIYPCNTQGIYTVSSSSTRWKRLSNQLIHIFFIEFLFLTYQDLFCPEPKKEKPSSSKKNDYNNDLINQIIHYMTENLDKSMSIDDFADKFYISSSYLKRIFKENTGNSIINYFRTLKLEHAKKMIHNGNQTFTEIAQSLGYDNIHHFSTAFKQYVGFSPSKYKLSIKAIEQDYYSQKN